MRIDRIEPSRHKKGRILVFLEDGACLKITEQELLDFGLHQDDDLEEEALTKLKDAAGVSNTRAAAADLINKRPMSRRDLERKLQEKGASPAEARYASEWLEAIGALNDAEYAAALARHYSAKGYGPARIKEKLYEKGIPKDLWEDALTDLPENASQIDAYISKKLRGTLPDEKEKRRISNALLRRGYGWGDIKEAWGRFEGA
ncbi:MAG: regulatory protein RecX [Oscillibacter sp.]|nr:regulatory protein RecX [Oscillibacter sp.]